MLFSLYFSFILFAQQEVPQKIDEDGVYHYNTKTPKKSQSRDTKFGKALETEDGDYYYDTSDIEKEDDPAKKAFASPKKKKGNVYTYEYEKSPQTNSISVQYFQTNFEDFKSGSRNFESVYKNATGILVDYEWQFKKSWARLGLIINSGILVADGKGYFIDGINTPPPKEKFDAYFIPLVAKLRINLEFLDTQYIVPYIEGGGGLIGLTERRDDNKKDTYAYTPVFTFGGGLAFLLDWMMGNSIARLDNDMGINHMWLVVSFQLIQATESDYDLSTAKIAGGLKIDF